MFLSAISQTRTNANDTNLSYCGLKSINAQKMQNTQKCTVQKEFMIITRLAIIMNKLHTNLAGRPKHTNA